MSFFGINIKKIRVVKKLNQTEFANLFDLTRSAIGAYEEGRAEAKIEKVIEIADYFGVSLDQILRKKITLNEIFHYEQKKQNVSIDTTFSALPYVDVSRTKQYIKNFSSQDFIDRLPKIIVPYCDDTFMAFQISNSNFLFDNDILICTPFKEKENDDIFYLVIDDNQIVVVDKIPPKKNYIELWRVKMVLSNNLYKFNIIDKLNQIERKIEK